MWHGIVLSAWFILVYLDMDRLRVICKKSGVPLGKVKEKGFNSILKYGKHKKLHETFHYLQKKMTNGLKEMV